MIKLISPFILAFLFLGCKDKKNVYPYWKLNDGKWQLLDSADNKPLISTVFDSVSCKDYDYDFFIIGDLAAQDYLIRKNVETDLENNSNEISTTTIKSELDKEYFKPFPKNVYKVFIKSNNQYKVGVILNNKLVLKPEYEAINLNYLRYNAILLKKELDKYNIKAGAIDITGKILIPFKYDDLTCIGLKKFVVGLPKSKEKLDTILLK